MEECFCVCTQEKIHDQVVLGFGEVEWIVKLTVAWPNPVWTHTGRFHQLWFQGTRRPAENRGETQQSLLHQGDSEGPHRDGRSAAWSNHVGLNDTFVRMVQPCWLKWHPLKDNTSVWIYITPSLSWYRKRECWCLMILNKMNDLMTYRPVKRLTATLSSASWKTWSPKTTTMSTWQQGFGVAHFLM